MLNKRFCAVVLTAVMSAALLAGCGSSNSSEASSESATESTTEASAETSTAAVEETTTYAADAYLSGITASDYVTLPDYSSIDITVEDPREDVDDEAVEATIESTLENSAELVEVTDRDVAEDGDIVNIDYVGKLNGEEFSGGSAEGSDLELGSDTFIDGFEDGVVGMKVGETKTLTLTFPENYSATDLAGQETTFDVTLNKIQEYQTPELTDEWVADQGIDDVTTVDEYKAYVKEELLASAQEEYDANVQNAAGEYVYENATWKQDPPTALVDRLYDTAISQYETYATYYGVTVDELLSTIGTSTDELRENAEEYARRYICLQAVADENDLNLSEEDLENEIADMAASYGYDDAEEFKSNAGENELSEYLTLNRAAEFLASNSNVTVDNTVATEETAEASTEAATEAAAE